MPLRDRVPRSVFDRHPSLVAHRFEAYLHLGRLFGREARVPPAEDEALAGFPDRDAPELEGLAVAEMCNETASDAGFEGELTVPMRGDLKEMIRPPPRRNFARE